MSHKQHKPNTRIPINVNMGRGLILSFMFSEAHATDLTSKKMQRHDFSIMLSAGKNKMYIYRSFLMFFMIMNRITMETGTCF